MAEEKKQKTEEAIVEGVARPSKAKPRSKKAKAAKHVPSGRAYVQATYNNTIVTFTDLAGNVLAWSTSGHLGFRGPKKATPYAASMVVRDVAEKVKPMGLRDVHVFVRGVGSGRDGAVRALHAQGLNVLTIKDVTPIPHNGPRAPKPRRV
jgi:small subunit ribosomal protein S11